MISKKTIIERYLADLRNLIPDTPARQQRIELLEAELESESKVKTLGLFGVVQQRELLINFMTFYDGDENSVLHDDMVKIIDLYLEN